MKKFALIGCGKIAGKHAENIVKVGKLLAVCDVVKERREAFAAIYNARVYENIDQLLQDEKEVDVVAVCTPNGMHAEHTIKSLQAGKHVLCEKPLCLTSAAAWQINETEKFCRRKLFVVKSTRYNPLLQEVKKAIQENQLGKIYSFHLSCLWNRPDSYYIDWRGKTFPDGGTLYTQFSHYIDAMLWLLGDVEEVKGFKKNAAHSRSIDFEDTGVAALQMQSGTLGSLHWSVNSYKKNHEIALTLVAEKATIRLGGEYLNQVQYTESVAALQFVTSQREANEYTNYQGSMSHHKEVYDHLLQVLDNNEQTFTGAYEGLKTVEAIEKIYKAIS
ncbi:MAG TPA: Gfo/Idh/MocA family oxidoreductase [Flavisolibacter sp.]|jgi:predicted dehydrogenase|nr:Gfo/Idh/MocA family oxidoreductase [Flavisolibacter sp.]